MAQKSANTIVVRPNTTIGKADAYEDDSLLFACFENTGHYDDLRDTSSSRFIVKGRTGSGKSALLRKVESEQDNVIRVDPNHLCLQYISNSDIMRLLAAYDIKLDPFLDIIWRHTFATELLRHKYGLTDALASNGWLDKALLKLQPNKRKAVEYLRHFGVALWPELEERVTAITKRVESDCEPK